MTVVSIYDDADFEAKKHLLATATNVWVWDCKNLTTINAHVATDLREAGRK